MATAISGDTAPRQPDFGRYVLCDLLGTGGMGSVYRALDTELDELVALKVLRPELTRSGEMVERFRREVKLARRVTHPNVARTFDIGEHHGERFLTMELIEGESLATVLSREGALRLPRAIEIAEAIATGLSAAHAAGVVHRDLKPDNVLIERRKAQAAREPTDGLETDRLGRIVLTDFGIARAYLEPARALTRGGMTLGTPEYMAPEQLEMKTEIDARADLYAVGVILYEMVVGDRPWNGDSPFSIAAARLVGPPPDPRARAVLPDALADIIMRCMARRPDDRFARAEEVRVALQSLPPSFHRAAQAEHLPRARSTVACASTLPPPAEVIAPIEPSPPSMLDAEIVELDRRARLLAVSPSLEDNDRAIALYESALQRDEDHPSVNAGYASAMLRRFVATEGGIDDTVEISAMLERALSRAPSLSEPWIVRAGLAFELGDLEGAVRDLQRARAVGSHSAESLRLEGRILVELGDLVGAVAAFASAIERAPERPEARWDEAAALTLAGDRSALEAALSAGAPMLRSFSSFLSATRIALWHHDRRAGEMLLSHAKRVTFDRKELVLASLSSLVRTGGAATDVHALLDAQGEASADVPRRRCLYHQLGVELGALFGDAERALDSLDRAERVGLCDLSWLERCALLAPLRHAPRFQSVLGRARTRADRARAMFAGER